MTTSLIFYTDKLIPEHSAGCVRVFLIPVIFIRPKYKADKGLLEHEKVHVKQAWKCIFPPIHMIWYALSKSYRLKSEVEAYKEQLKHYSDNRTTLFAGFISKDYNLDITQQEAEELLKG